VPKKAEMMYEQRSSMQIFLDMYSKNLQEMKDCENHFQKLCEDHERAYVQECHICHHINPSHQ
jgi:hypothetical protein